MAPGIWEVTFLGQGDLVEETVWSMEHTSVSI